MKSIASDDMEIGVQFSNAGIANSLNLIGVGILTEEPIAELFDVEVTGVARSETDASVGEDREKGEEITLSQKLECFSLTKKAHEKRGCLTEASRNAFGFCQH